MPTVGSIWHETKTGRNIRILLAEVYGTGPAWTYTDEPNGWYYCDLYDFLVWNRFTEVMP